MYMYIYIAIYILYTTYINLKAKIMKIQGVNVARLNFAHGNQISPIFQL